MVKVKSWCIVNNYDSFYLLVCFAIQLWIDPFCLLGKSGSDLFKYFPLPAGPLLSLVSREHERDSVLPSGSCSITLFLQRRNSGQRLPVAPHRPLMRHLPEYSFPQHTRGRIPAALWRCGECFLLAWAPMTPLPSNEPRPCCLQRGQNLSSGGVGERTLPWIFISTLGIVALLYCYFWHYIIYLLFLYSLKFF